MANIEKQQISGMLGKNQLLLLELHIMSFCAMTDAAYLDLNSSRSGNLGPNACSLISITNCLSEKRTLVLLQPEFFGQFRFIAVVKP
jgi:hypothetical protein